MSVDQQGKTAVLRTVIGFPSLVFSPGKTPWCFPDTSGKFGKERAEGHELNARPQSRSHQSHRSIPKMSNLILASASPARQALLRNAGIHFESHPVRIDEDAIRLSMVAEAANPRDIANVLAEFKARRCSSNGGSARVLGADQILALDEQIYAKPKDRTDAAFQLKNLAGKTHYLFSAAVLYENGQPVWRHVGTAKLTMHRLTDQEISDYLELAWPAVQFSVGAYHAEAFGARLFSQIRGDWFSVLGLPLLELLSYLRLRGMLGR